MEYVAQLLTICEYLPHHQPKILDLIIKRCIEIDVDIVIEDSGVVQLRSEENEEESEGDIAKDTNRCSADAFDESMMVRTSPAAAAGIFSFEDDDEDAGATSRVPSPPRDPLSVPSEGTSGGPRISADAAVAAMADRLDGMLEALLSFISRQMDRSSDAAKDKLFLQLLAVFEYRALPTHKSKFVQFVMFYSCSRDWKYADAFARRLLELFLEHELPDSRRQSAVMYLASFLCRLANQQASLVR